ncbi:MAG: outer membrane protein [Pseudomonadota bacterium]
MRKFLLTTSALLLITTAASAADMRARTYTKAPPPPPAPIYNWTGFYLGGHLGAAFSDNNNPFFGGNNDAQFMGGGQVGFDYQFAPSWVMGLEANYSFLTNSSNINRGLGSVTGRLGWTWGPGLLYVKGGYAWADTRNTFGFGQVGSDGYTVGAGIEYMFAPSWSAKVEYQYYDFGSVNFVGIIPPAIPVAGTFRNDEHTIKVGLNYRFNFGNAGGPAY